MQELVEIGLEVWLTKDSGSSSIDWIALGFSELGSMRGSDIALIKRVHGSSETPWILEDRFGTQFAEPPLSDEQLKRLVSVEESSEGLGALRVKFTLPRHPCNISQHENFTKGVSSNVIYAYGSGDFSYHGPLNRGGARIMLQPLPNVTLPLFITPSLPATLLPLPLPTLTPSKNRLHLRHLLRHSRLLLNSSSPSPSADPPPSPASITDNPLSLDLIMPSLKVPNTETDPYMCFDFLLPNDTSYSITSFDAIVNSTGGSIPSYVHHQLLYNYSRRPSTFGKGPYKCSSMESGCNVITLEAANRQESFSLPPEAGFRMGQGGMSYVVLQIHYNNLPRDSPTDNSGFRIHYTRKVTRYDIGVLVLGWELFFIPEQSMGWSQGDSICPSSCTSQFKGPLHVVRAGLHMHRLGSAMITRHARRDNGTGEWNEMRPLASVDYYDFDHQASGKETPVEDSLLLPGDALVTRCTWDNPGPRKVDFGRATSEEMCYSFVQVYPLENLNQISKCTSVGYGVTQLLGVSTCYDENAFFFDEEALNLISLVPSKGTMDAFVPTGQDITAIWNPFVAPLPSHCPA